MKKSNKTDIGKLFRSKLKNNVSENILTNNQTKNKSDININDEDKSFKEMNSSI